MTVQLCTARAAATPGTRDDTGAVRPRASTGARSDGVPSSKRERPTPETARRRRGGSSDDPDASDADASDGLSGDDDDARRDRWEAKRRRLEVDRSRRRDARSGRDLEHHRENETSDDAFFDPATEGTPGPPCVLRLEYWMRSEACTERKRRHVEAIDARGGYWGMEEHIERTVFGGCADDDDDGGSAGTLEKTKPSRVSVALEPNMFPYECPPGVTHWTLWSRSEMSPSDIVRWTKTWLRTHKPNVAKWNFDMNDNNSVDVPHYHVFLFEPPRGSHRRDADKADDVSEPRGEDEEHPSHAKNANTRKEDAKRSEKTRKAPRTPSPFGDEAQEPEK
jgi:hypothetical protein